MKKSGVEKPIFQRGVKFDPPLVLKGLKDPSLMAMLLFILPLQISKYLRGQILAASSVAILSILGLFILNQLGANITLAVFIGIIAGLANLIPMVGPFIGMVPAILIALFISWLQTKKIAKMPLTTAILVVVFGGLTIWLNNPVFIKMKPTIIYLIFSAVLFYGLLNKKSYIKYCN